MAVTTGVIRGHKKWDIPNNPIAADITVSGFEIHSKGRFVSPVKSSGVYPIIDQLGEYEYRKHVKVRTASECALIEVDPDDASPGEVNLLKMKPLHYQLCSGVTDLFPFVAFKDDVTTGHTRRVKTVLPLSSSDFKSILVHIKGSNVPGGGGGNYYQRLARETMPADLTLKEITTDSKRIAFFTAIDQFAQMICAFRLCPVQYSTSATVKSYPWIFVQIDSGEDSILNPVNNARAFGFITKQRFNAAAFLECNNASLAKTFIRDGTRSVWHKPIPCVIGLNKRELVDNEQSLLGLQTVLNHSVQLEYITNFLKRHAMWTGAEMEFPTKHFLWGHAKILGAGAHGKVIRVPWIPPNYASPYKKPKSKQQGGHLQSMDAPIHIALIEEHYRSGGWSEDTEVHAIVALKATTAFHQTSTTLSYRGECLAGMLMTFFLPTQTVGGIENFNYNKITSSGDVFQDTITPQSPLSFDNRHILPTYGWLIKEVFYGVVMMLAPYELAEIMSHSTSRFRLKELDRLIAVLGEISYGRKHPSAEEQVNTMKVERDKIIKKLGNAPLFNFVNAVKMMAELLHGLCFMHLNRFVHRDLKPGNLMLNHAGQILIVDFGFAIPMDTISQTMGSPFYVPPFIEKDLGTSLMDYKDGFIDLYATGVMILEDVLTTLFGKKHADMYELYLQSHQDRMHYRILVKIAEAMKDRTLNGVGAYVSLMELWRRMV